MRLSENESNFLITFIKNSLITKSNGINASYVKNPSNFLDGKIDDKFKHLIDTKEKLINFIYDNEIIIPINKTSCCAMCNKKTSYLSLTKGFREFCSYECFNKSPDKLQRIENGFIKKYNVKNCLLLPEIQGKAKKTLNERYNVDNVSSLRKSFNITETTKAKIKETHSKRSYEEKQNTKNKRKQTNILRYGVEYSSQSKEIQDKIKETNILRYGVDNVMKSKEFIQKTKKTSISKYGVSHFSLKHFKNYKNFNKSFIIENFIKDNKFLIEECMLYFNVSYSYLNKFKRENDIKTPNKIKTLKSQTLLYDNIIVENKDFNNRNIIKPYELDIVLLDYKIAIEYNGLYYHSVPLDYNITEDDKYYHLNKTRLCDTKGIELLHIFDNENIELWLSLIHSKIGKNKKIHADECVLRILENTECSTFLENNHILGTHNTMYNYGLIYNDEIVCLMCFNSYTEYEYELVCFCSLKGYDVIDGYDRILKEFRKHNDGSIISYSNTRMCYDKVYYTLGFSLLENTEPRSYYFSLKDKHRILKPLDEFNDYSNKENYRIIFDCGNSVFVLK